MHAPTVANSARRLSQEGIWDASLERAKRWLLQSGIYILERNDPQYGAVYSRYDTRRQRHELIYAEATGYVLSLLAYLANTTRDKTLAEHAAASGDWLVSWFESNNGMISMGLRDGVAIRQAYTFDNGVCCKGLIDLYQLSGDDRYLQCAQQIATWLIREAQNDDGSVKPVFDMDTGRFVQDRTLWYKVSGSFQAKVAMPLFLLHSITGDKQAREAAVRLCKWAVRQQRPDGSFPANMHTNVVNVHFHCYTVEALLYASGFEQHQEFLVAAERGINWAARMQRTDGSLPRWCRRGIFRGRGSEAQAQVTRIFSLMNMLRPHRELEEAARKAGESLMKMQRSGHDTKEDGGFAEVDVWIYRFIPRKSPYMTSWSTMFALQALHFVKQSASGGGDFTHEGKMLF
jgi:uncharacterized protein YyaL (SSP411 family)